MTNATFGRTFLSVFALLFLVACGAADNAASEDAPLTTRTQVAAQHAALTKDAHVTPQQLGQALAAMRCSWLEDAYPSTQECEDDLGTTMSDDLAQGSCILDGQDFDATAAARCEASVKRAKILWDHGDVFSFAAQVAVGFKVDCDPEVLCGAEIEDVDE